MRRLALLALSLCLLFLSMMDEASAGGACANPDEIYIYAAGACCWCDYFAGESACRCWGGAECHTCGSYGGWCCIDYQDVR